MSACRSEAAQLKLCQTLSSQALGTAAARAATRTLQARPRPVARQFVWPVRIFRFGPEVWADDPPTELLTLSSILRHAL